MLVKSDWMPKNDMCKDKSCFRISLQNENESCAVYSLKVYVFFRNWYKKFARLYVEIPIIDKIGWNVDTSLVIGLNLWNLHNPYIIPGLLPHGFKYL